MILTTKGNNPKSKSSQFAVLDENGNQLGLAYATLGDRWQWDYKDTENSPCSYWSHKQAVSALKKFIKTQIG